MLALLALLPTPALADGLIDNVNGLTIDKAGKVVRFNGLLIDKDGKVSKLLERKDKRPERPDFKTDGKGLTLMPGIIDAHGHVMGVGFQALTLDLSAAKSLEEAKTMIAAYVQAHPDRKWILGTGWNQEAWGLGRFPTAADLDAVVSDRPVWLRRVDGHAGWANSAAMAAAGVTAKTASPAGGRIEKTGAAPGGVFVDAAMDLIQKSVPEPLARERDLAFVKGQQTLLSYGITAIADMGTSLDDWMTYRRAGDNGGLHIRILSYAAGVPAMIQIGGPGPSPWLYSDKLRMVGVKLLSDGALGSRGAWLKRPYHDAPNETGLGFLTDAQLRNLMSRAAMDNFQVAVHAIGDKANAQLLDAIDELAQTYKGDRRWRVEHAQIVDPVDIARFGQHGTIASMQPVHQTSDRLMAEARLGPDRLAGAYAWETMIKAGSRLAFGSDTPVESPDPFAGIAAAFTREDAKGQPFGGWQPQERVTREQALAAFTTGGAYASFAEDRLGSLTPGMRADFILIDTDPLMATPAEIRATKVRETWVGGRPVYTRK
ncbi:amidohydrolase [Sphingomonas cavernae]|uniref:Amidohydrolase n=1 Tax=Sphingomonas cavernae TaxID=2320861 RepID=A0A418WN94_9SPHN|nr:amidohydrolase [Sphingomonas cavernae]RJF91488.1 amidohydrolase [Sphingomonas cavernae]